MYKLVKNPMTGEDASVTWTREDGNIVNFLLSNTTNRFYLNYQDWIAEGNVPEPSDPLPTNNG